MVEDIFNLPEGLNEEEIINYLKLIKEGNKEARDKFIIHNIKLVIYIIKLYYSNTPFEFEDLLSIGIIGLIKSVDTFDLSRNIKFSSYATVAIQNEIRKHFKIYKKAPDAISLDKKNDGFNETMQIVDENIDIIRDYELNSQKNGIKEIIDMLSFNEKDILSMHYGFKPYQRCYSTREISQKYNVSHTTIAKTINMALLKIKELIIEYGYIEDNKINKKKK